MESELVHTLRYAVFTATREYLDAHGFTEMPSPDGCRARQAAVAAFEKIYSIERHHIDVEIAGGTREEAMTVAAGLADSTTRRVVDVFGLDRLPDRPLRVTDRAEERCGSDGCDHRGFGFRVGLVRAA